MKVGYLLVSTKVESPQTQLEGLETVWCSKEFAAPSPALRSPDRVEDRKAGPMPKLSAEQVRLAGKAVAGGESVSSVARSLEVSRQALYRRLGRSADD